MTPIPAFHEEWFSTASQETLARLVRSVADVPGLVVEFGSWEGRSTIALANAAWPRPVCAVDTWQGSPSEISAKLAAKRDVHGQFLANIRQWTKGNVAVYVTDWAAFLEHEAEPVAMAFIDAEHTYEQVHGNILALLSLIQSGGVICGDDAHHPPVIDAVRDVLGGVELEASLWIWRAP